jgi:hypothetical protein
VSCVNATKEITKQLSTTVTANRYEWFTGWMPATGVDYAKFILKVKASSGAQNLIVQPAFQVAKVRTNNPDNPSLLGDVSQTGNGETPSVRLDISATTASKQYVRFGVGYKASSSGDASAMVSLQAFTETYGKIVATETMQLVAPDTNSYYVPLTGWMPSMMVTQAKAALVVTDATGNFKVGLTYQIASTSTEVTSSWVAAGSLYASGEHNTGEQTMTYGGTPPEAWVRLGLRYTNHVSGTNGQGVVTASVSIRK